MQLDEDLIRPIAGSKKIYIDGTIHSNIRVPMREIALSNATTLTVYDTSGAYTDPTIHIDVNQGLPAIHKTRRAKVGCNVTQMHYAKRGVITPEMEFVTIRENMNRSDEVLITAEFVRNEVASGRAIIPANIN